LPLAFGAAPIGGLYAPVSDETAAGTLAAAWAAGIRAFDTAPHYGAGLSERRVGEFLAGRPRDEFVVATKVGRRLVPAAGDVQGAEGFYGTPPLTRIRDYSRDGVRRSLEESLGRLGLDRVDIALIHDPDDFLRQAADAAYPALAELRSQGAVRAVGAGMNSATALTWLVERCDLDCVLVAGRYTLLDDAAADRLFPLCLRRGVAVLAGGVFNSGILAGRGTAQRTTTPRPRRPCWRVPAGCATPALGTASRWPRRRCGTPCVTRPSRPRSWAHAPQKRSRVTSRTSRRRYRTRCGLSWKPSDMIAKLKILRDHGNSRVRSMVMAAV
jgi:D-threo-aldose 1-dehydrogenase